MDEQTQATIPPKATPTPPMAPSGAPRPITVKLRPVAPMGAGGAPAPVSPATAGDAATVKLRPISPTPSLTAPIIAPGPAVATVSPAQMAATVQAAKSKTSRISLDSAIGVTPSMPIAPGAAGADKNTTKTIRLKRPTDLESPAAVTPSSPISPSPIKPMSMTAAIITPGGVKPTVPAGLSPSKTSTIPSRKTSRIPDSAIPTEPSMAAAPAPAPAPTADSSTVTQKKTLKIRRAGAPEPTTTATGGSAGGSDPALEGVALTPISEIELPAAPVSQGYKVFSAFAVTFASIAAIVMIVLTWCLAADVIAPFANKNTAASIQLDAQLPWPDKLPEYK
jgi:hypothetical protein